jgi:hypothetical protein
MDDRKGKWIMARRNEYGSLNLFENHSVQSLEKKSSLKFKEVTLQIIGQKTIDG